MGLGGRATGSVDFEQASPDSFLRADARLSITGFTRTTAASVSQPVDVNFAESCWRTGRGASRHAQRGSVVGRLQASLRPLGPGADDWMARLRAAPLGGGIRYNGPADTLYSFAGPANQRLAGPIAVAADFSCSGRRPMPDRRRAGRPGLREPDLWNPTEQYDGERTLQRQTVGNRPTHGDRGRWQRPGQRIYQPGASDGYPMNIAMVLDNARPARSENIAARATGNLTLEKTAGKRHFCPEACDCPKPVIASSREGAAQVPVLTGVRRKPPTGRQRITGDGLAAVGGSLFDLVRLDIALRAPDEIYVTGMGLESEWKADVAARDDRSAARDRRNRADPRDAGFRRSLVPSCRRKGDVPHRRCVRPGDPPAGKRYDRSGDGEYQRH